MNESKERKDFIWCVGELLKNKELVKEFNRLWGHNLGANRTGIEMMVDKACCYNPDEEALYDFIAFVDKYIWSQLPEEAFGKDCLSCSQSFSLPEGEAFDDGSIVNYDRLVCMEHNKIVSESDICSSYN